MRKIVAGVVSIVLVLPMVAVADGNHPMGGCGLGYVLFGKDHPVGTVQITAYTTNQSTYNQGFGILSGTSGCTPDGLVAITKETERYVEVNLESLRSDIAKGSGAYVNGLVDLLGIKETKKGAVILLLQKDYQDLFPSNNVRFNDFLKSLQQKLAVHSELLA